MDQNDTNDPVVNQDATASNQDAASENIIEEQVIDQNSLTEDVDQLTRDLNSEPKSIDPLLHKNISVDDIAEKFKNIELTFVQKINTLEIENANLEKQIQFYYSSHEKVLALVERQNYLNRLIGRINDEKKFATRNLSLKILKPVDWIEQTIASVPDSDKQNSWIVGLTHIKDRLITGMAEENIKVIDLAVGDKFDHTTCEAIEQIVTDKFLPNRITNILEKGYFLYDRVLRHARVIVSKAKDIEPINTKSSEEPSLSDPIIETSGNEVSE